MSDLKLAIKLTTSGGKIVVKDLQQVEVATGNVNHSLGATGKSGRVAAEGLTNASSGASALTSSLKSTIAQAAGVIGLGLTLQSLSEKIIEIGNLTQGWNASMQAITGSQEAANKALQHSRELAKHLGLDIKSTTDSYVQFTAATQGTALQGKKTNQVFDAISMSMRVLNRSSDDTAGALKALEQMVSKGTVQAEELRGQLGERLPGAFNLAAKAMGKTTKELGKMLQNGQVMAADLLPKLAKVLTEKYGKGLAVAINSPAQAFRNLNNATFEFNETLSHTFFNKFASGAQLLADSLTGIGDYLPEITSLLEGLSVVVGTRLLVAFITLTKKGITNYIKANIAASLSTNALGQVIGRTTVKMNLMAIAGRAAKGALALLGGPAGIAIIAASAFYSFAKSTFAADNGMKDLTRSIDKALGKFNEIEKKALNKDIEERLALLKQLQAKIAKIYNSAKTMNGKVNLGLFDQAKIADATNAMQTLGGEIQQLKSKLKALTKTKDKDTHATSGQIESITGLSKELQQLFDHLDPALASTRQFNQEIVLLTKAYSDGKISLSDYNHYMQLLGAERTKQLTGKSKELTTNKKLIAALKNDLKLSKMSATQKAIAINLSKLSADATQKEKDRVTELTKEKLAALAVDQQKQNDSAFYQKAIEGVNGYSDAWATAGNVIVDTFGSIGQQMEQLFTKQDAYTKAIAINHKKQQAQGADTKKLKAEELKLNTASTQAQLNSYSSIAGAASSMFEKNSKAAKAAHAIEQVLAVASLAMSIKKMIMSSTETGVVVANETIKQVSLGTTAIITQGQGDPYTAWGRIAAMAALVAGLGILTSGGGGSAPMSSADRQKNQGTGTVLGSSDKSQSLLNAYDRIEKLNLDQYAQLRKINSTLHDVNNNIAHLAVRLVQGYGKFDAKSYGGMLGTSNRTFSGFSKTEKSLMDSGISIVSQTLGNIIDTGLLQAQAYFETKTKKSSFWGLSSSTHYNTEYKKVDSQLQREFGLIFTNIGDSINSAIKILGINVATETNTSFKQIMAGVNGDIKKGDYSHVNMTPFFKAITHKLNVGAKRSLKNFVIKLPKLSFKGLSGDEIQKQLSAVFSKQADLMAQYLVPQIGKFQKAGEGLYDTLIRVSQEQVIFNSVLDLTAQSLNGLDANAQLDVAQSIIKFAGSIDVLQSAANTYLQQFFTEAQQFDIMSKQLNAQFASLNVSLPKTRDGFKNLLGSLDLTNESDQRLYAALMLLIPQLDGYYNALEKQAKAEQKLANDRRAFTVDLKTQLASFDMSTLQLAIQDVNNWRDNAIASAKKLGGIDYSLIEKIAGKKREKIVNDTLKQIISNSDNKMKQLVSNFDNNVNALTNTLKQLSNAIKSTVASIGDEILTIQKTLPSFNGVAFFGGQANSLRGQLGHGSASAQLSVIEQLKTAIVDKYNAEQSAISNTQSLLNDKYQTELDTYQTQLDAVNSLRDAAKSLKQAASDLLIGDLSTLTMSQQLAEAKRQYSSVAARAKLGDVKAYNNVQSSASNYLKIAQQYDPAHYQQIFKTVLKSFSTLGAKVFASPMAPAPNSATVAFQQKSEQLALSTIGELQNLQALTKSLTVMATQEYNSAFATLQTKFAHSSAAITQTMQSSISELRTLLPVQTDLLLTKMQEQIDAIYTMRNDLVDAFDAIKPPVINMPAQQTPIIKPIFKINFPIYKGPQGPIIINDPKPPESPQVKELKILNQQVRAQAKTLQKTQQTNELQAKRLDTLDKSFNQMHSTLTEVNHELLARSDKGAA